MSAPIELDDTVTVTGLAEILEDEEELPYLDLSVRCLGRSYRAAVLASDELYETQADAILAAQLMALDLARRRVP
jgi:hypothetical protein